MPLPLTPTWWTPFLQPLSTLFVGSVAAYIAWTQRNLAKLKQQHELYPSRIKIVKAVMQFVSAVTKAQTVTVDEMTNFAKETVESSFLFGIEVSRFIDDVREKALMVLVADQSLIALSPSVSTDERASLTEARKRFVKALDDKYEEGLVIFDPYLSFRSIKQPPPLSQRLTLRGVLDKSSDRAEAMQHLLDRMKRL